MRRVERSADRLSEAAIFFALRCVKTSASRSSASELRVTAADHLLRGVRRTAMRIERDSPKMVSRPVKPSYSIVTGG